MPKCRAGLLHLVTGRETWLDHLTLPVHRSLFFSRCEQHDINRSPPKQMQQACLLPSDQVQAVCSMLEPLLHEGLRLDTHRRRMHVDS